MTVLTLDTRNIAGEPMTGAVYLSVEGARLASSGVGAIVGKERRVETVDGVITTPELDPGVAVVRMAFPGWHQKYTIVIPPAGEHDLMTLIESYLPTDAPSVSQAWQYAQQAAASAAAGEAAAQGVSDISADVELVAQYRGDALAARQAAQGYASAASASATSSGSARDEAVAAKTESGSFAAIAGAAATLAVEAAEQSGSFALTEDPDNPGLYLIGS